MEGSRVATDAGSGTRRPARWITRVGWVVIPVLVFGAADRFVRHTVDRVPLWYAAADALAAEGPVDVVFIGNSRTAAAIPVDAFEQAVADRTGRRIRAINMGRGGATFAAHYFGLRNLIERHPESLRGTTVFVESLCGATEMRSWRDDWVTDSPWMLVEVLWPGDLPSLWRSAQSSVETRLMLTARLPLHELPLVARRERFRAYATWRAVSWVTEDVLPWMCSLRVTDWTKRWRRLRHGPNPLPVIEGAPGEDLRGWNPIPPGGYTPEALARQRRLIREAVIAQREAVHVPEETVQADLVALVAAAGGRTVFHEVPTSTLLRKVFDNPVHEINRQRFEAWVAARGLPHLVPRFDYDDRDMTDTSHLDPGRAPEYAAALADVWLASR
jgi:hypothetical protein